MQPPLLSPSSPAGSRAGSRGPSPPAAGAPPAARAAISLAAAAAPAAAAPAAAAPAAAAHAAVNLAAPAAAAAAAPAAAGGLTAAPSRQRKPTQKQAAASELEAQRQLIKRQRGEEKEQAVAQRAASDKAAAAALGRREGGLYVDGKFGVGEAGGPACRAATPQPAMCSAEATAAQNQRLQAHVCGAAGRAAGVGRAGPGGLLRQAGGAAGAAVFVCRYLLARVPTTTDGRPSSEHRCSPRCPLQADAAASAAAPGAVWGSVAAQLGMAADVKAVLVRAKYNTSIRPLLCTLECE